MKKSLLSVLVGILVVVGASTAQATTLDLTPVSTLKDEINGVIFAKTGGISGQGTGVLDPFLALDVNGQVTEEKGFNTDGALQMDQKDQSNATHAILLSGIPLISLTGYTGQYYEILFDIADRGGLTMDALEFSLQASPTISGTSAPAGASWSLDNPVDSEVLFPQYTGQGIADIWIYVPESIFDSVDKTANPWFYLYTELSSINPGAFEELGVQVDGTTPVIPEPTTLSLLGLGLLGLVRLRKKKIG